MRVERWAELFASTGGYIKTAEGNWYAKAPSGDIANLSAHEVVEHDDGTITVSPSILVTGRDGDTKTEWHGFLERGVWREC